MDSPRMLWRADRAPSAWRPSASRSRTRCAPGTRERRGTIIELIKPIIRRGEGFEVSRQEDEEEEEETVHSLSFD